MSSNQISVDLNAQAHNILNGENLVAKTRNVVNFLVEGLDKLSSSGSPQIDTFKKTMKSSFVRLEDDKRKLDKIVKALAAKKAELMKLEGAAEIFAAVKQSMTQSNTATKTKLR